ncbi:MAG: DUF2905 domain-containing protein [Desulfomonilia bacterium]|nr:DUF2905 domain-containing protein [Desulfomonilia bacterium]
MSTLLIVFGFLCIVLGLICSLGSPIPWLGRLPGDIRIVRPGYSINVPLTTSLLISVVVSMLLSFFRAFR